MVFGWRWCGCHDDRHVATYSRGSTRFPFNANWLHFTLHLTCTTKYIWINWLHEVTTRRRNSSPRILRETPFPFELRGQNVDRWRSPSPHSFLLGQPGSTALPRSQDSCLVWCGVIPLARAMSVFCPTPWNALPIETNKANSVYVLWMFLPLKYTSFTVAFAKKVISISFVTWKKSNALRL